MRKNYLVFTDLDGTLLDHHDYSHTAAQPALDRLSALDIPVILNSSKTLSELEFIAQDLGLDSPRIAENGSLVAYPDSGRVHIFGAGYLQICQKLNDLRQRHDYCFKGFSDWNDQAIAEITGLSVEAAQRAKSRQASEPLLWQDDEALLVPFREQLAEAGLSLKRGGRFWHVMGNADKVHAMDYLSEEYSKGSDRPVVIALGDGPNDRDMLAAADIAVIVYNPDGVVFDIPERQGQRVIRTELPGPQGWEAAINEILDE